MAASCGERDELGRNKSPEVQRNSGC